MTQKQYTKIVKLDGDFNESPLTAEEQREYNDLYYDSLRTYDDEIASVDRQIEALLTKREELETMAEEHAQKELSWFRIRRNYRESIED